MITAALSRETLPAETIDPIEAALALIPPLWPLDHFVAVNPYLGFTGMPFAEAGHRLHRDMGAAPVLPAGDYLHLHSQGEIDAGDLAAVAGAGQGAEDLLDALRRETTRVPQPAPSLARFLDQQEKRVHWEPFVADEVTKWCGTFFDRNQTTWRSPWAGRDLWSGWREAAQHDRNPEFFGLRGFRANVGSLPEDPTAAILACLTRLRPNDEDAADFLASILATQSGWAGYVQYLVREETLRGRRSTLLREFLALRVAIDYALLQAQPDPAASLIHWHASRRSAVTPDLPLLATWQAAYERGYQRHLAQQLAPRAAPDSGVPAIQAVFCIDVRSEVFRRHLEHADPACATLGFAGFFGFAIAHRSAAAPADDARCPVLLVPAVRTEDPAIPALNQPELQAWQAVQNSAASCFGFVETSGLAFTPLLLRGAAGREAPVCQRPAPRLDPVSPAGLAGLAGTAAAVLRNLGLTQGLARIVLFCGHGARSANNPHASSLDCGACGGFAGDVNARLAAAVLNDPAVRQSLAGEGIVIPAETWFMAGLHNTTTDEVQLFELEQVPPGHRAEVAGLEQALAAAGTAARRERAAALGLDPADPRLRHRLEGRTADISEVRPEWGLANNAAIIIAPRGRTRGLDLGGRTFLHEYRADQDPSGSVLELILAAPVVVASWINLQYYASRVSPGLNGAGNKTLHQVMGGIGVVEGNGGDLRAGLPWQSLHDGHRFRHEPRRLSVYVEAPVARLTSLLGKLPAVRALFDHGWIHLFALEGPVCQQYRGHGCWSDFPS